VSSKGGLYIEVALWESYNWD